MIFRQITQEARGGGVRVRATRRRRRQPAAAPRGRAGHPRRARRCTSLEARGLADRRADPGRRLNDAQPGL